MLKKQLLSLMLILNIAYGDINESSKESQKEINIKTSYKQKNLTPIIDINLTNINKTHKSIEQNNSVIIQKQIHIKPANNFLDTKTNINIIKLTKNENTINILDSTNFTKPTIDSYRSTYLVKQGDTIAAISKKFKVAQSEILMINPQIIRSKLKAGKEIFMPLDQEIVDSISNEENKVIRENILDKMAKKIKTETKELNTYSKDIISRKITNNNQLILPLPSNINKLKSTISTSYTPKDTLIIESTGKQLRVTASAYTSEIKQTSSSPFIGAWGHRLTPGEKTIAVSRDLIAEYGLTSGSKVKIGGLDGLYTIKDKMNKRYTKHIDIYMGLDKAKALRWGRRSAMIYW